MIEKNNIAIVGATDLVGETFLDVLSEKALPINQLYLLDDDADKIGDKLKYGNQLLSVESIDDFDFSQVGLVFFLGEADTAKRYAPTIANEDILVIDTTGAFAHLPEVPTVVAGINDVDMPRSGLLTAPCSAVTQMARILQPIHEQLVLERVDMSVYQGVAAQGKKGVEELAKQTAYLLNAREIEPSGIFPKQMAFNLIPNFKSHAENSEENIVNGVKNVLNHEDLRLFSHVVQVPIFYGEGITMQIQTRHPISAELVETLLQNNAKNIMISDDIPTPVTDSSGKDDLFVGGISQQSEEMNIISLWAVSDNIRSGVVTNCLQMMEKI